MFMSAARLSALLLLWAADVFGAGRLGENAAGPVPDESHFRKAILATNLNEPIQLSLARDGRVYFGERHGAVKVWRPGTQETATVGRLDVFSGPEDGLLGLALDPGFLTNHWLYIFHSTLGVLENRVSRFTLDEDVLNLASEKVLLRI